MQKLSQYFDIFLGVSRFIDLENNKSKIILDKKYFDYKMFKAIQTKILITNKKDFYEGKVLFEKEIDSKNFIKKNDIVVKLAFPLKFIFIDCELDDNYLVSSQYCILRNKNNKISTLDFWAYLNNEKIIKEVINKKEGNHAVSFIKTPYIKEIDVDTSLFYPVKSKLFYNIIKQIQNLEKKKELLEKYQRFIKY